jgi:hypothetical protein
MICCASCLVNPPKAISLKKIPGKIRPAYQILKPRKNSKTHNIKMRIPKNMDNKLCITKALGEDDLCEMDIFEL